MNAARYPRPQRTVIVLTVVASAAMLVPGAWMWTDPQSFARFANWPDHAHFLHDAGAFQMAIGLMLLAALRLRDVLTLALGGFLFGNTLHAINHAKDLHLGGGNVFDPYVLLAFSVLAALALRTRQLRRPDAGTEAT